MTEVRPLEGKVAIITGGGGTIGPHYARALSQAGAAIALVDLELPRAEAAAASLAGEGATVLPLQADVGSGADVERAVAAAVDRFERIDILVNNAGYATTMEWGSITEAEWDRVMSANLKGCFLMAQAVTPMMQRQGWGKIVSLTSTVFHLGPPNLVHYVAAKAGVIGFTRALARALGPAGVTVNAIAPGLTASEPTVALYSPEYFDKHAERRALKRWAWPADLVGTLVFLCSPDSDFMTGQTIVVDGGQVFD